MIKWRILFDLILIFPHSKKIRESNIFTKQSISRIIFCWEQISRFSTHFATKCYNMKIPWNLIFTKEPLSLICDLTKKVSCFFSENFVKPLKPVYIFYIDFTEKFLNDFFFLWKDIFFCGFYAVSSIFLKLLCYSTYVGKWIFTNRIIVIGCN